MTLQDIQNLGIVGAGGAGFPTHIKLQSKPEFLIMNAAECEPLLHKDKELLLRETDKVLEGFRISMALTGAKQGIVGIKARHQSIVSLLRQNLSGPVRVVPIGDFYPAGDEVTLVYLTTGRVVQPGSLPIQAGCLVQNVETLYNIGAGEPVVGKWLTVAGAVENPATVKVPIGTPLRDVLSGFKTTADRVAVRSGGLMMGVLEKNLDAVVTKTTGGLIVLPSEHPCVVTYERYATERQTVRMAKAACDQCNFCTELCPRYLLGYPVRPETAMRNRLFDPQWVEGRDGFDPTHPGNAFCCECNLCTLYACPESLDPRGATVIEKKTARNHGLRWEGLPVRPHPMLPYRKVPMERLKQRLGVADFRDEGPITFLRTVPDRVRIPLLQHAGKPAVPVVHQNDAVKRGQCIAAADGAVSANVHASIDGRIVEINANEMVIQRQP